MIKVGDVAPDFTLPSHQDEHVTLSQFRGKKNVLLAFYPLNWTDVCSGQIPAYHEELERFKKYDTQVLAVSVDSTPSHKSWAYSMGGIDYPLLSDFWPHGATAQKYDALTKYGFTERLVIIIDKEGIVRYVDYHDINDEPDINEVFKALEKITKA